MPSPSDNHIDHLAVSRMFYKLLSLSAIRTIKIVYYEIWSVLPQPTHYIDISDVADRKRDIINIYKSQTKHVDYASRILALNHYRGIAHYEKNIQYEEDFTII
jgi:LmbE family N-acetylglucosaminyl deacetylase